MKGDERRYTYFLAVYNRYSRIDFIFTSQDSIPKIVNTEINSIKITDHALMSMAIEIKKDYKDSQKWRMDINIFQYPEVIAKR